MINKVKLISTCEFLSGKNGTGKARLLTIQYLLNEHLIGSVLGYAIGENSEQPVITEGEEQGKLGSIYLKAVSHQHDFTLKSTSANFVPK